jgi:hypothetical protein
VNVGRTAMASPSGTGSEKLRPPSSDRISRGRTDVSSPAAAAVNTTTSASPPSARVIRAMWGTVLSGRRTVRGGPPRPPTVDSATKIPVRASGRGAPSCPPAAADASNTERSPAAVSDAQTACSVPAASMTTLGDSIMSAASAAVSGTRPVRPIGSGPATTAGAGPQARASGPSTTVIQACRIIASLLLLRRPAC